MPESGKMSRTYNAFLNRPSQLLYHCVMLRMLSAVRNMYISEGLPCSISNLVHVSVLSLLISQHIKSQISAGRSGGRAVKS